MRLVYEKPALRWGEALPLGNGQIGAMVYGGADCEEIDLTEHTFYSGEVEKTANREGAAEAFQKMRKAEQTEITIRYIGKQSSSSEDEKITGHICRPGNCI